jgi:hypothetical protein
MAKAEAAPAIDTRPKNAHPVARFALLAFLLDRLGGLFGGLAVVIEDGFVRLGWSRVGADC